MSAHNFNVPQRQSAKGILVIFGYSIYKIIRASIIIIAAFFIKYFQGENSFNIFSLKVILPFIGFILFFLILAVLKYRNFMFHVDVSHFILKKGIVNKEEISISKSKIQNVYIKQNLLQQIISVVSLSIETAGDDKTEIEIKALKKQDALALKQVLLSGTIINDDEIISNTEDSPVFFKPSIKHLLLEGISENHLKSFILVFAFLMTTYNDIKDIISDLEIGSQFNAYFQLDNESLASFLIFNIAIVIAIIIVSFLFSLIKTLVQNFNLTVLKKSDGFEISKGLFNKTNLSLKTSRIQTATVVTNRFKKALGLYQMRFTQAMINKKERQKFNIIGLNNTKVNALVESVFPSVLNENKKYKPNKYMIYKVLFVAIIPILLINGLFMLLTTTSDMPSSIFLVNIPIIILILIAAIYSYKKKYYCIDNKYVIVGGGGFIDTTKSYLELHKTQAVALKQSIFQRRRHLASLEIFTASKSLKIPHIDVNIANTIKNYLLFKVESDDKDWM